MSKQEVVTRNLCLQQSMRQSCIFKITKRSKNVRQAHWKTCDERSAQVLTRLYTDCVKDMLERGHDRTEQRRVSLSALCLHPLFPAGCLGRSRSTRITTAIDWLVDRSRPSGYPWFMLSLVNSPWIQLCILYILHCYFCFCLFTYYCKFVRNKKIYKAQINIISLCS